MIHHPQDIRPGFGERLERYLSKPVMMILFCLFWAGIVGAFAVWVLS